MDKTLVTNVNDHINHLFLISFPMTFDTTPLGRTKFPFFNLLLKILLDFMPLKHYSQHWDVVALEI